jgi:hypothetical protein
MSFKIVVLQGKRGYDLASIYPGSETAITPQNGPYLHFDP